MRGRTRYMTGATLLAVGALTLAAPVAWAQEARPEFSVDAAGLPPLLLVTPKSDRDRQSLIAAGTGALVGIVAADVFTGGLLLAPLGLPSFANLVGVGAGAGGVGGIALPPPVYTVVQQILGGVATTVASLGGGYLGMRVAGPVAQP